MRCELLLREQGNRLAKEAVAVGVPERFVAKWQAEWQAAVDRVRSGSTQIDAADAWFTAHCQRLDVARFIWNLTGGRR
jgi:hypothetical protein